jgi:SAM-dependent methyltransferase
MIWVGSVPDASLRFDPDRELADLRAFLGDAYSEARLRHWERQLEQEYAEIGDEASFYRRSEGYLYNLTAFAMSGTKLPYLAELMRLCPPGSRVLDYGCGIGSDGLMLLEAGYRVEFADFDNPSVRYLRWRLARRGLQAPIHDLDSEVPLGFDCAYAFDVIEHVPQPIPFLRQLEARAKVVLVNLLESEPGETALHQELPVRALLDRAAMNSLLGYRIFHGRSHLVAYSPGAAGFARRWGARARIRAEALRARLAPT